MENERDKIAYSESRTINVGNYENINCFASVSMGVRHFNRRDKTITISHSESVELEDIKKDIENSFKLIKDSVKSTLDKREKFIRLATEDYVDFSTMNKFGNLE